MLKLRTIAINVLAFYLITVISAAPNRFERSKCPEDRLLVYVNMTESDRTAYQISRIGATSLLECTQKCYDDPRCSALTYREADPEGCMLTSYTPADCHHVTLVPVAEIKYDTRTLITIECLKCQPEELLDENSKPCVEGSECLAAWAINGTAPSLLSSPSSSSSLQNINASASAPNVCDPSSQRCREDVLFIANELSDSENLDFLNESMTADSAKECAEKCFENCCEMAAYSTTEKKCHFTRKSTTTVNSGNCEATPLESYVNHYNGSNLVQISCVTCGSASKIGLGASTPPGGHTLPAEQSLNEESENDEILKPSEAVEGFQTSSSQQPEIASAIDAVNASKDNDKEVQGKEVQGKEVQGKEIQDKDTQEKDKNKEPVLSRHDPRFMERACIVVFEVDPNVDVGYFRGRDYVDAGGVDHCAYLCYRDACSAAVFNPSNTTGKKGTCERRFDGVEKCNGTLRRDYHYDTDKPVYLQCFRCLPEKPHTKPPLEATTRRPEASPVAGKEEPATESVAQPGIAAAAPGAETTAAPGQTLSTVTAAPAKASETGSKEVEAGVPGTVPPESVSGSAETSGGEEESKEEEPRAEGAEASEAGKSSQSSTEQETKSVEQLTTASAEAAKEEAKSTTAAGGSTPAPVGGSSKAVAAAPGYESEGKEPATLGTASSPGGSAPSVSEATPNAATPASDAEKLTPEPGVSASGEPESISGAAISSSVQPGTEGSAQLGTEGSAEPGTTSSSISEAASEKHELTIPAVSGTGVQSTLGHESASAAGSEGGPSGPIPLPTAGETQETTKLASVAGVESTAGHESTPEGVTGATHEASTPSTGHFSESAGVTPPAVTEEAKIGAELYSSSTAMMPGSAPPTIHATPEIEHSSDVSQDAGTSGSNEVTQESSPDEKVPAQTEKPSVETKSSEEGATSGGANDISRRPLESETEGGHFTSAATEAPTSKVEGSAETVIASPTASVATSASADKSKPTTVQESVDEPTAIAKSAVARPHEYLQGCIVTFQADPYSERPAESSSGFQASTIARTSEVCAGRCYQDGCTGAKYDPATKECVLGYGGKQICTRGPEHFFYEANETVWIHCTGCKLHKPGDAGVNILIDPTRAKSADASAGTVKEATTAPTKAADSQTPKEVTKAEATIGSSEIPKSVSSEGSPEKGKETSATASGESVESGEETAETTTRTASDSGTSKAEEKTEHGATVAGTEASVTTEAKEHSAPGEEASTAGKASVAAEATSTPAAEASTAGREVSISTAAGETATVAAAEASTALAAEASTVTAADTVEKKTEVPKEELNIDAVPTAVGAEKGEVAVNKEGLPLSTTPSGTTIIGHGCVVSFQAGPLTTRPTEFTSEFVPKGTTPTAEECAKRCYTEGCTGAKFDPANRECSLTFGDHQQCDQNEEEHQSVEATETLWIHCISCRREFTDNTLGLLVEDTTIPPVTIESPKEEVSSGTTSGDSSVSKSKEAEEKFLSTVSEDANPEPVNSTGSEIISVGDKSVDALPETMEGEQKEVPSETVTLSATGSSAQPSATTLPSETGTSQQSETASLRIEPDLGTATVSRSASESVTQSTRLPASVSEIKSEETAATGEEQVDTTPVVVVLEKQDSTTPSTSQSLETKEESVSTEHSGSVETATKGSEDTELSTDRIIEGGKAAVDVSMVTGTTPTEASIMEKIAKTINNDGSETTINPEVLISATAQTPLSVPIDTSEILHSTAEASESSTVASVVEGSTIEPPTKKVDVSERTSESVGSTVVISGSSTAASVIEESTIEPPEKKIEVGERKEGKDLSVTVEFQQEDKTTAVPEDVTVQHVVAHGEVTTNPEATSEAQSHGEVKSDIASAVASVVANVASGSAETGTEAPHAEVTNSVLVGTAAESHSEVNSSPETSTVESHAEVTSSNNAGTAETESHAEVTQPNIPEASTVEAVHNEVESSNIPDTVTVEPVGEVTSHVEATRAQEHAEVTSGISESTHAEGDSAGGTLFSGPAANAITEQPSVQESVDDNIKKVIQAASNSGVVVTEATTAPPVDATVAEEEAAKKEEGAELGAAAGETTDSTKVVVGEVTSKEDQESTVAAGHASTVLPMDLTTTAESKEDGTLGNGEIHAIGGTDASVAPSGEASELGEHLTTEPPVQAVSDLVNVISQNSKIEEVIRKASTISHEYADKEKLKESFAVDDASIIKDKDEQKPPAIAITHLQEGSAETALRRGTKMSPFQGTAVGCPGRIEFEVSAVGELPRLNVTSEVATESPADCAKRCYENTDCVLAGFVPRPSGESTSAVCLLTADVGICSPEEKSISQHTSDAPFIISCLRCSKCNYTINAVTELTRIRQAETVEPVLSIGQCAEACSKHNCAVAQYDHKSNLCSLTSVKRQEECSQETPIAVDGDEPVLLECVRCFA